MGIGFSLLVVYWTFFFFFSFTFYHCWLPYAVLVSELLIFDYVCECITNAMKRYFLIYCVKNAKNNKTANLKKKTLWRGKNTFRAHTLKVFEIIYKCKWKKNYFQNQDKRSDLRTNLSNYCFSCVYVSHHPFLLLFYFAHNFSDFNVFRIQRKSEFNLKKMQKSQFSKLKIKRSRNRATTTTTKWANQNRENKWKPEERNDISLVDSISFSCDCFFSLSRMLFHFKKSETRQNKNQEEPIYIYLFILF